MLSFISGLANINGQKQGQVGNIFSVAWMKCLLSCLTTNTYLYLPAVGMEERKGLETLLARSLHLFKESYCATKHALSRRENLQRTRQKHASQPVSIYQALRATYCGQKSYKGSSFVCKVLYTLV